MSVHNASKKKHASAQQHMTNDYSTPTKTGSRAGKIGTVATISGLLIALGAETFITQQRQQHRQQQQQQTLTATTPLKLIATPAISLTMLLTGSVSMFFVYRHKVNNICKYMCTYVGMLWRSRINLWNYDLVRSFMCI